MKNYYEGDPTIDCPTGCKGNCPLECYIEIHQALVNDKGERTDWKTPYVRDGRKHCCGKLMDKLSNGNYYCSVCGTESK